MTNHQSRQLPCLECGGRCCQRDAYGSKHACIVSEHEWRDDAAPDRHLLVDVVNGIGWLPFNEDGRCIMLDGDGRCSLQETPHKPEHCVRGDCVREGIVDRIDKFSGGGLRALLTLRGVLV